MEFLIDSNVLIDYVSERFVQNQLEKLDKIFDDSFAVSVITKIETLGYNAHLTDEERMKLFLDAAVIIRLDDEIVQRTIDLKKSVKIKTPDAIIAATAITKRLTLLSRNTTDFAKIPGLKTVDPYKF